MKLRLIPLMILALLPACNREGGIEQGGIYVRRSACPIPGIPAGTGDITLFNPSNSITAEAIDVTRRIRVQGEVGASGDTSVGVGAEWEY